MPMETHTKMFHVSLVVLGTWLSTMLYSPNPTEEAKLTGRGIKRLRFTQKSPRLEGKRRRHCQC